MCPFLTFDFPDLYSEAPSIHWFWYSRKPRAETKENCKMAYKKEGYINSGILTDTHMTLPSIIGKSKYQENLKIKHKS